MTEENKVSKEDTEEPLYFELKDNISSFYISDSDILKCILIADANHKIPTLAETAPKIGLVAHFNLSLVARFNFGLSARFNFGLIA